MAFNKKKKHIPSKGKPTKVFPSQFVVSSPSDLIEKIICHFTDKDDEDECTWVKVIALNIIVEESQEIQNLKYNQSVIVEKIMSQIYIKIFKMGKFSCAMLL